MLRVTPRLTLCFGRGYGGGMEYLARDLPPPLHMAFFANQNEAEQRRKEIADTYHKW
jgi:hypothetical protein